MINSSAWLSRAGRRLPFFLLSCVFLLEVAQAQSQSQSQSQLLDESAVKATFIYYFLQLITWPKELDDPPIRFCVVDVNTPTMSTFEQLLSSPKAAKMIVNVSVLLTPRESTQCDYIFIDSRNSHFVLPVLSLTNGMGILTVSDAKGFASAGGIIELERNSSKVKIVINREALSANGLKASSKLMKSAEIISTGKMEGARHAMAE
ncbi:MAG: YfiR family protein [Halioglobus sp.]